MKVRLLSLLVAAGAVLAADACSDPTAIKADRENIDARTILYAFNGTPSTVPSALRILSAQPVRMDASFLFDLAFDINAAGEVVVYTVRAVASELASTHRVGLLATDKAFADADRAPTAGYKYDSLMVVPVGQTIFAETVEATCSIYSFYGQNVRAKFVIDSVKVPVKTIYLHVLSNPNCGFRTLTPGEPKD